MITRRNFIGSCAATCTLLTGASWSAAAAGDNGRKFLFLHAEGGWDPLCVFAPMFDSSSIDMEPEAAPWTLSDLKLVDHPSRPQTRTFFESHHRDILLLNGVSMRSVNHETCQMVGLTGTTSEERPDWASILGYEDRDATMLPHLVVSGPSFSGDLSVYVSHAEGLLQPTIDRSILFEGDNPVVAPSQAAIPAVDRALSARGEALSSTFGDEPRAGDYGEALKRAKLLSDGASSLHLTSGEELSGRIQTAVTALASGVCRCASLGTGYDWDTHGDNAGQTENYESLFAGLDQALMLLSSTNGPDGRPLRENTIVVVTSEMARTPKYNLTNGRDHWPYTSMFLMGPGISGGRSLGGYSSLFVGIGVDAGGNLDPSLPGIAAQDLGATLLQLGGVDPGDYIRGAQPIPGVIA